MLAGGSRSTCNRPENARAEQQLTHLEKKAAALEGERDMMKHMLNSTQKERDDLMRDVQRLHSQGPDNFFSVKFSVKSTDVFIEY